MANETLNPKMNNIANVKYTYTPNENLPDVQNESTEISNIVQLDIQPVVTPSVAIKKLSSNAATIPGDVITYTLFVINDGNIDLSNIVLKDRIDEHTVYVPNSTKLTILNTALDQVTLPEYTDATVAQGDDIFDDNVRWKLAVFARDFSKAVGETVMTRLETPKEDIQAQIALFDRLYPYQEDGSQIKAVNDDYIRTNAKTGPAISGILTLYSYVVPDPNTASIYASVSHFDTTDVMRYTPLLILGQWGDTDSEGNPITSIVDNTAYATAIENTLKVIDTASLALQAVIDDPGLSSYHSDAQSQLTALHNRRSTFDEYLTQSGGSTVDISKIDISVPDALALIQARISSTQNVLSDCLPQARYVEVPNATFNVRFLMFVTLGMSSVLGKIPEYEVKSVDPDTGVIAYDYTKPNISRLTKILDVAKDGIAAVDTIAPLIPDTYIKDLLTAEKNKLEAARQRIAMHTQQDILDTDAGIVASAIINIKKILDEAQVNDPDSSLWDTTTIPIHFIPVTSAEESLDPNLSTLEGHNEPSPKNYDTAMPTVLETVADSQNVAIGVTSYAAVPDAAKEADSSTTTAAARDINIHINDILPPGGTAVITFEIKVNGNNESEDETRYSINYDPNVSAYNASSITNHMGVGFTPSQNGLLIDELKEEPPDFDNPEDPNTHTDQISSDMNFAKLIVSKDVYKKVNGTYTAPNENITCGDEICYLITLKNYGNVNAENVNVRDLLRTGLILGKNYQPHYYDETSSSLESLQLQAFTTKIYYPPDSPHPEDANTDYQTGINNDTDQVIVPGYPCVDQLTALTAKAAHKASLEAGNMYGLLVKDLYFDLINAFVPARSGNITAEYDYDRNASQQNTANDAAVGVLELRLYYTVKCNELSS